MSPNLSAIFLTIKAISSSSSTLPNTVEVTSDEGEGEMALVAVADGCAARMARKMSEVFAAAKCFRKRASMQQSQEDIILTWNCITNLFTVY